MATLKATVLSCVLALTACQMGHNENEVVGSQGQAITLNGITLNGITLNGLDDVLSTADGRNYLTYLFLCALDEDQTVVGSVNGQVYEFTGSLGLAPEWVDRGMDDSERRWLSACLVAHINEVGATVEISTRAEGKLTTNAQETEDFATYEGTFFGYTFGQDIEVYSCSGDLADVAMANSPDRAVRTCADDSAVCGVNYLGACRDICDTRNADNGWTDCWANGERYSETISVYLNSPDDDGNNEICSAGENCNFKIKNAQDGILDLSEADNGKGTCKDDSICAINGTDADKVRAVVKDDSIADINCHGADTCKAKVTDNSSAIIDCKDADKCTNITCTDGSDCLLDCTGADDCGFAVCEGELNYCDGDVVVCGRGCP